MRLSRSTGVLFILEIRVFDSPSLEIRLTFYLQIVNCNRWIFLVKNRITYLKSALNIRILNNRILNDNKYIKFIKILPTELESRFSLCRINSKKKRFCKTGSSVFKALIQLTEF